MNNKLNKKFLGLPLTGFALMGFSATNAALLIVNAVMPMVNGTLMEEYFSGAEGAIRTGIMSVLWVAIGVIAVSYVLMALLGVNAIRFAGNPEGVKARTGLAKFLVFTGVISVAYALTSVTADGTVFENLALVFPAAAQLSFVAAYLMEVKAIRKESMTLCA